MILLLHFWLGMGVWRDVSLTLRAGGRVQAIVRADRAGPHLVLADEHTDLLRRQVLEIGLVICWLEVASTIRIAT